MKKSDLKAIIKECIQELKQANIPIYDGKKIIDFAHDEMDVKGVSKKVGVSPNNIESIKINGKQAWRIKK